MTWSLGSDPGAVQLPASVEANYGASMLEWVRQTYDGRMDFGAVTTSAVEDLAGNIGSDSYLRPRRRLRLRQAYGETGFAEPGYDHSVAPGQLTANRRC